MRQRSVVRLASRVDGVDVVTDDGWLCDNIRGARRLVGRTESACDSGHRNDDTVFHSAVWSDAEAGTAASQSAAVQLGPLVGGKFGAYFGE